LRLFALWLEQSLLRDRLSLRLGQIAADDEFFLAPSAAGLIDSGFGWASILAANQVQGGPVFPLAAPGTRLKAKLTDTISTLAAVFYGDPAGHAIRGDPQGCNRTGTTFSVSGEPLWMGELQIVTDRMTGLSATARP
jgi:porin